MLSLRSFLLFCSALAVFNCAPVPEEEPEYRIGVLGVLTGPLAVSSGRATVNGAQLAAAQINAGDGVMINGVRHKITLVIQDHENRPDAAAAAARALINQHRVDAIVGPQLSDHAIPVARIAEASGIPMISPMSTNPETTANKRFVFRIAFLDDFQGKVMAEFAATDLGARRAAVLFDVSSTYSRDLARIFVESFEAMGGSVVASEAFTGDDVADFSAELARIRDSQPQVVFLPNFSWIVKQQIREAREMGVTATLLGGDTWDLEIYAAEPGSDGSYATHQWTRDLPTPEAEAFRASYRATFDEEPGATSALTFDAVQLLGRAITISGSREPEAVRSALAHIGPHDGASGHMVFDGSGDPARSAVVSAIVNGQPTVYRVVDPQRPS